MVKIRPCFFAPCFFGRFLRIFGKIDCKKYEALIFALCFLVKNALKSLDFA